MATRVVGLREAQRAFRKAEGGLLPMFREELKEAAEPVAATARTLVSRYRGAKTSTIKPHVTMNAVAVRQNARKVTSERPDFGALQMRNAFIPALEQHSGRIISQLEEATDRFLDRADL